MVAVGLSRLKVASLWRRSVAGLIDIILLVPPIVGAGALFVRHERRAGRDLDLQSISARWQALVWVAAAAVRIPTWNWRSPGSRALGLRRVDASTGEPVSARNVVVHQVVSMAFYLVRRRLMRPWQTRFHERARAAAEVAEARRHQPENPEAQRGGINVLRSCATPIVVALGAQAPVVFSPLHQTIAERVAGIVVVQDSRR